MGYTDPQQRTLSVFILGMAKVMGPIITQRLQIIPPWESLPFEGREQKGLSNAQKHILCLLKLHSLLLPVEGNAAPSSPGTESPAHCGENPSHCLSPDISDFSRCSHVIPPPPQDLPPVAVAMKPAIPWDRLSPQTLPLRLQQEPHPAPC